MRSDEISALIRRLLPFIIIFGIIIVIASIIYALVNNNREGVSVSNLDQVVRNVPDEKKASIQQAIEVIVAVNNPEIEAESVKDSVIRQGSDVQERVEEQQGYTGSFIIDIESLKQSYRVNYSYSSNDNSSLNSGYPVYASCLKTDELIYGEFDCKESTIVTEDDKLLGQLPYEAPFYTITSTRNSNNDAIVVVQIMVNTNSSRTKAAFDNYRNQANSWITSQGVELADYVIQYRNLTNEIVD